MKNESAWAYLSLGEERTVSKQIKERSRQDAAYQARQHTASLLESSGGFDLMEAVICTYIDLERQIEASDLSAAQRRIVDAQMEGHSLRDVAELTATPLDRIERDFRNAVSIISRKNFSQWKRSYARKES